MGVRRLAVSLACAALCAACGSRSDPTLYVLGGFAAVETPSTAAERIGLSEVSLPAYARQAAIASASGDNQITQDDDHRWAAPPSEAVSAALARALEARLDRPVALRPYPRGFDPDIAVQVTFDHFLRGAQGQAEMAGQYIVVGARGVDLDHIARFQFSIPASGAGYGAYVAAVEDGLERLAGEIAEAAAQGDADAAPTG